jgi:hypothetical protein
MPKQFTHLLLTRFNIEVDFAPNVPRLDTDWLTGRLALFEQYCLPSIAAQRGAEFRWLIFFDEASPAWFKEKMATFAPLVQPVYIGGLAPPEVIARRIVELGLASSPHLITTRIDSDDALSKDCLALVQDAFREQEREFVTFPFGFQLFHGHLYNIYWPPNPFLSLIERVGDNGQVATVLFVAHHLVADKNDLRKVVRSPQWLQVIHGSNLANTLRGWPRLSSLSHQDFQVVWPETRAADSIANRFRISAQTYVARAGRRITRIAGRQKR